MKKLLVIKACYTCLHYEQGLDDVCRHPDRNKELDDIRIIPDWCPLPDVKSEQENETVDRLRAQLQNCVDYLERAKRKHPHDGGNYCIAIESANKVLYETLLKGDDNG